MQINKTVVKWCLALLVAIPCTAWGQDSSINSFSPYSMYGLGEIRTPGTLPTRSMGGVGVGMRNPAAINLLNPASYSMVRPKTFIFDFGVESQNFYNTQKIDGRRVSTSHNSVNFHDIAFQLPVAKGLGLGFSLTPYSSVGYRMRRDMEDDRVWGTIGRVQEQWDGDGDLTEVKLGVGWEVFKNFSIGLSAQYYWGDINRMHRIAILENIVGPAGLTGTTYTENYSISRFKGQAGVQWSPIADTRRILTIGATYDIGGNLNPRFSNTVQTGDILTNTAKGDTVRLTLRLPRQIAVGAFYATPKIVLGADYVYQNWGQDNSGLTERSSTGFDVAYANTNTFKVGVGYTPNRADVRNVFKRWTYRAGARYGNHYQTFGGRRVDQYAVTLGVGIPIKIMGASFIDVGVEFGQRGNFAAINAQTKMVKQTYFKFSVGITMFGEDYWFVRPKYD